MYIMIDTKTEEIFEGENLGALINILEYKLELDGKTPEDYGYEDWQAQSQEIKRYIGKGWHWYTPDDDCFEIYKK